MENSKIETHCSCTQASACLSHRRRLYVSHWHRMTGMEETNASSAVAKNGTRFDLEKRQKCLQCITKVPVFSMSWSIQQINSPYHSSLRGMDIPIAKKNMIETIPVSLNILCITGTTWCCELRWLQTTLGSCSLQQVVDVRMHIRKGFLVQNTNSNIQNVIRIFLTYHQNMCNPLLL